MHWPSPHESLPRIRTQQPPQTEMFVEEEVADDGRGNVTAVLAGRESDFHDKRVNQPSMHRTQDYSRHLRSRQQYRTVESGLMRCGFCDNVHDSKTSIHYVWLGNPIGICFNHARDYLVACHHCHVLDVKQDCFGDGQENHYCKDCCNIAFVSCSACSSVTLRDNSTTVVRPQDKVVLCTSCVKKFLHTCAACSLKVLWDSRNEQYMYDGKGYCKHCFHKRWRNCKSCGATKEKHDLERYQGGHYCDGCAMRARRNEFIESKNFDATYGIKRFFSMEIECYPHNQNEKIKKFDYVREKGDGSLAEGGVEYNVGVIQGTDGVVKLRRLLKKMSLLEYRVDDHCGLHVHVDARDISPMEMLNVMCFFYKYEPVIYNLLPVRREKTGPNGNRYCGPLSASFNVDTIKEAYRTKSVMPIAGHIDRYHGFNMHSLFKFNSLEFRYHQGSVKFEDIYCWLIFLLKAVEMNKNKQPELKNLKPVARSLENLREMVAELRLPKLVMKNFIERYQVYGKGRI